MLKFYFMLFALVMPLSVHSESLGDEKTTVSKKDPEPEGRRSIFLPFGYYTPETKVALGFLGILNFNKEAPGKTSSIISSVSQTFLGQSIVTLSPRFYTQGGVFEYGGTLFYSYFPSKYYGNSVQTALRSAEDYTENNFLSSLSGGWNFFSSFYLRGSLHSDLRKALSYESSGRLDSDYSNKNIKNNYFSLSVELDERVYPQSPKAGRLYRLESSHYHVVNRENGRTLTHFRRYNLEAREYFAWKDSHTLATQLLISEIQGGAGAVIPFQYLNSIGGPSRLRGFYNGRYRDRALILAQLENRFAWKDKWETALFGGVGGIGESLAQASSKKLATFGAGVRYLIDKENRTVFRFDLGFGAEKMGVYVVIGEAF